MMEKIIARILMTQSVSFCFSTLLFFDPPSVLRVPASSRGEYLIGWEHRFICSTKLKSLDLFVFSSYCVTHSLMKRVRYLLFVHPIELLGKSHADSLLARDCCTQLVIFSQSHATLLSVLLYHPIHLYHPIVL